MNKAPPLATLVAHVRTWVAANPRRFYGRHLETVHAMADADIAEMLRHAKTTKGAEMALVNHLKEYYQ